MDIKNILIVALVSAGLYAIFLVAPPTPTEPTAQQLPWQIEVLSNGDSRVFGLILNKSSLADAEQALKGHAKVSLFRAPAGNLALEAYFEHVALQGLKAKMILNLDLSQDALVQLFDRGARIRRANSGDERVTLANEDLEAVRRVPVSVITYLPAINLDEEVINARFGKPTEQVAQAEGSVYWLYPDQGLSILVDPESKEILQYVTPRDFAAVRERLLKPAE